MGLGRGARNGEGDNKDRGCRVGRKDKGQGQGGEGTRKVAGQV